MIKNSERTDIRCTINYTELYYNANPDQFLNDAHFMFRQDDGVYVNVDIDNHDKVFFSTSRDITFMVASDEQIYGLPISPKLKKLIEENF